MSGEWMSDEAVASLIIPGQSWSQDTATLDPISIGHSHSAATSRRWRESGISLQMASVLEG